MAIFTHSTSLLTDLHGCHSVDAQVAVLCQIKNYIAGHELRKRLYIRDGLLQSLRTVLDQLQDGHNPVTPIDRSAIQIWTQTASIVCVVAHGGPHFVRPILESHLVAKLLDRLSSNISLLECLALVRCLNAIADNLPLSEPASWDPDRRLTDLLYTENVLSRFTSIIRQASRQDVAQETCDAIQALICKTCQDSRQRTALVGAGVLSSLCERVGSFIVAEGLVIPQSNRDFIDNLNNISLPEPALQNAQLSLVLETIATIVEQSRTHALEFLQHPTICAVLPTATDDFSPSDLKQTSWGATYLSGGAVPSGRQPSPLDLLLPDVPATHKDAAKEKTSFPPLGVSAHVPKRRSSSMRATTEALPTVVPDESNTDEDESLIIPWLLYLVRSSRGRRRLAAIQLLAVLSNHKLVSPLRARSFGPLLVPVLISMLDDVVSDQGVLAELSTRLTYTKAVPLVLSRLIADDLEMQKTAVDAKVIPKLAVALKATFDHQGKQHTPLWKPLRQGSARSHSGPECSLGSGGPSLEDRHTMRFREGVLRALAAIAPYNDLYRKEICDQGILTQIVQSLKPFNSELQSQVEGEPRLLSAGNSTATLLAACSAVRALTRSVTALRTKLVDVEVGKAVMKLMYCPDPEIRIAATKIIANLAMDFSPLKQTVSEPDLMKKLCEQVHSANARLRLESIWALKLLVLNAPNKFKRDVIDELGPEWIKYLIKTDAQDMSSSDVVIGAWGKDHATQARSHHEFGAGDIIMGEESDEGNYTLESRESTVEGKQRYDQHTVQDDLEIQEQLIDLIRNLFCGETASDVVDYLLGKIGYDDFVDILTKRLRPRTLPGATRRANQVSLPPKSIVVKVLYVIVHLAACAPKFRFMISDNQTLIRLIAGFCSHADAEIRTQCCWIIINLTYEDDQSDKDGCRQRASALHRLGLFPHMRRLETDLEPNVRERAKTAAHLLEKMVL